MVDLSEVHAWVGARVRKRRFEHIQRVVGLAADLADHWHVPRDQVVLAALLHDCARDMPVEQLVAQAQGFGIEISVVEERSPVLLHAPVGAELARQELGITDTHVLDAIRFHTTGRAGMTLVEKIVFIADYAEPARKFVGVDGVRTLLQSDLNSAVRRAFDQMFVYLIERGWLIHPRTNEARNDLYLQVGAV